MNRKKVLYIGGFELPDKNAAAQRVIANTKLLRDLGYESVLIGVDKTRRENRLSEKNNFEGFDFFKVKYPQSKPEWLKYIISIENILPFVKNGGVTHIIAYNYPAVALYRLSKFCNTNNIKLIGDCTEWYEPKGNIIFRLLKGTDVYLRMKIVQPKLDGLIVISDYLYEFYLDKVKKLINVPPLIDLSMKKWKLKIDDNSDNCIKLIYAGSPGGGGKDRIDIIINAISEIREQEHLDVLFNIVGITKDEYLQLFYNKTLPQGMDNFISFKGRLSHPDTIKEISKSDYMIFIRNDNLTNRAGFPTKFVESISCGTPVLTNSSSNIEKFFNNGQTGYILDTSSYSKLKDGLFQALSVGKQNIRSMKHNCRNNKTFNYLNYIHQFRKFMDGL